MQEGKRPGRGGGGARDAGDAWGRGGPRQSDPPLSALAPSHRSLAAAPLPGPRRPCLATIAAGVASTARRSRLSPAPRTCARAPRGRRIAASSLSRVLQAGPCLRPARSQVGVHAMRGHDQCA